MTKEEIYRKSKEQTAVLAIYYDDLAYTLIEESPKYDIVDLVSNIGGNYLSFFESS